MKDQILLKATEMFLTLGFKSVTMDDIAAEMGISKKTIYQHFSTKPDLVKEVTLKLFESISCGIDTISENNLNPIEELFEIKNFVLQHLKNESASPIYQLQKYYPKLFSSLKQKQFQIMQKCVIENLEKGVKKGLYRADIDVDFISRIYFIGVTGIKDNDMFPLKNYAMKNLMNQYLDYHLRGICTPNGILQLEKQLNEN